ncbi:hypothetical protein CEF21_02115 [Bacillus sp. FJAT-42376]|nr:hypothetical protein CEF21_02115 [Bacillus sp. FJAT-42376]
MIGVGGVRLLREQRAVSPQAQSGGETHRRFAESQSLQRKSTAKFNRTFFKKLLRWAVRGGILIFVAAKSSCEAENNLKKLLTA